MVAVKHPKKNVRGKHKFDFVLDEDENGEFCVVPLTGRGGPCIAKIDPEDYEEISQCKWYIKKPKKSRYSRYAINGKGEFLHREIMNPPKGIAIDHINGDGLDNRRANLRIADACQNQWNQRRKENGTSKFKGVSWCTRVKKWAIQICYKQKFIWLGYYDDEVEAARAYDRAAVKYFGVFARLNFPLASQRSGQEAQMSYTIDEQVKARITKRILELKDYSAGELWEILAGTSVKELEDMCRVMQCNISELSQKISRQATRLDTVEPRRTACLPSQGRGILP